ncbi:kynureninase [Chondrinema litorale]|uniref:kynureninase n=1 Tax=Chondrinema litorale TaxID=2994555 RepID=UPI002542AC3C|nr:kynureninase [Chondrinema litorale]UZR95412.1 kynureninase [Chondrinema litorale]
MSFSKDEVCSFQLDQQFKNLNFRDEFIIPKVNGEEAVYFCGNSLGLQSKKSKVYINEALDKWENQAVEGHFTEPDPWMYYHKQFANTSAKLIGALTEEVVIMNTLTVNLHLLLVSFYRPTKKRFKILMEGGAFPSDQYAIESQINFHAYRGEDKLFNPNEAIIEIFPENNEENLKTDAIIECINKNKDELALVMMGGVNYYTGQFYDLEKITHAAHQVGAIAGFDLAHAAGNIPLKLHNWQVDFAVWCTYKYLNSGPGGPAGAFIHNKYANATLPRFAGWWGHDEKERFKMQKGFKPMYGAESWQVSNAPIFSMVNLKASLEIFEKAGIENLRKKSIALTQYLEYLIDQINIEKNKQIIKIITPHNAEERGCQLSLVIYGYGKKLFNRISENGVICDWREPDVIRVAPVPLYNTFADVYKFYTILKSCL